MSTPEDGQPTSNPSQSTSQSAESPPPLGKAGKPTEMVVEGPVSLWSFNTPGDPTFLPPWFRRAVVMVIGLVLLTQVAVWGFGQLTSLWYMLFFAFFLGLAIEPAVNRLAVRGMKRGLATGIVMGGLLIATVLFFTIFGNLLFEQLAELIRAVPGFIDEALVWINENFDQNLDREGILEQLGISNADLANYATEIGLGLLGILGSAVGLIFTGFTILLFTFYFAADGPTFRRTIASWLPPRRQRTFLTVWEISTQKAGGYVISRGIMALISAFYHGVVFLLIDLPYWLPMALWVGVVSQFVPTIGTYLAIALPAILALAEGEVVDAVIVIVAATIYQQIENYYVQPKITQSTLEINAAVAFGSVIAGASLFGATGALLAIPVVATVQSVLNVYGHRYQLVPELDEESGDLFEDEDQTLNAAMKAANKDIND